MHRLVREKVEPDCLNFMIRLDSVLKLNFFRLGNLVQLGSGKSLACSGPHFRHDKGPDNNQFRKNKDIHCSSFDSKDNGPSSR